MSEKMPFTNQPVNPVEVKKPKEASDQASDTLNLNESPTIEQPRPDIEPAKAEEEAGLSPEERRKEGWRTVEEGEVLNPGYEISVNIQTGEKWVKPITEEAKKAEAVKIEREKQKNLADAETVVTEKDKTITQEGDLPKPGEILPEAQKEIERIAEETKKKNQEKIERLTELQKKEDEFRALANEIDAGRKPMSELEGRREEHKTLAKEMIELGKEIFGKEAEEKFQKDVAEGRQKTKEQFLSEKEKGLSESIWQKRFQEAGSKLSERQQKEFNILKFNHKILEKDEVEVLLTAGFSLDDIKNIKYNNWFSSKIKSALSGGKPIDEDKFYKQIEKQREIIKAEIDKQAKELLEKEWEEKHKKFIAGKVAEKVKALTPELPVARPDEVVFEEVKEDSKEEKLEQLNELRDKWKEANKIFKALKKGKQSDAYKWKKENVELTGKLAKGAMQKESEKLSDEILNIVNKLSGRKLREEALTATGYDPNSKDKEKQEEFRNWLTREVELTYKELMKDLEKSSGKKIAIKKRKK